MMVRVLIAAIVARSSNAFLQSATRTARRSLAARALPPHLETVKADVAKGDALLLDVREPHEWAAAHFASATFSAAIKVASRCRCHRVGASRLLQLFHLRVSRRWRGGRTLSTRTRLSQHLKSSCAIDATFTHRPPRLLAT